MKVAATWVALVAAAGLAVAGGDPAAAVLLGGAKAVLLGLVYLELGHAARPHAAAWVLFVGALAVGLAAAIA